MGSEDGSKMKISSEISPPLSLLNTNLYENLLVLETLFNIKLNLFILIKLWYVNTGNLVNQNKNQMLKKNTFLKLIYRCFSFNSISPWIIWDLDNKFLCKKIKKTDVQMLTLIALLKNYVFCKVHNFCKSHCFCTTFSTISRVQSGP